MKKPYITAEEALAAKDPQRGSYKMLTEDNGCVNGCCTGVSVYSNREYPQNYGAHDNQEGFLVLEGEGIAKLDDLEFPIKQGDSFIAAAGVRHTIKSTTDQPVKVFWFHAAV